MADATYADAVHEAFTAAAALAPIHEHDVELAGHALRIRFVGTHLHERLATSFDHLAPPPAGTDPALVIEAWDRTATSVAPPPPPWDVSSYGTQKRIVGLDETVLQATFDPGHGLLSLHRPGAPWASFVVPDARLMPRWVARMPFRHILGWWAGEVGLTFAHASAVGRAGACVLLPGASGSGKSTTALAADDAGFTFLADDLCLIDPACLTAHSPYRWAKAEPDALGLLPGLAARVVDADEERSIVRPANLIRSATVVGLALPTVTGGRATSMHPATPAEVVLALAPTMAVGVGAGHRSLSLLATLARAVPAVHLRLGTDMGGVVTAIDQLLHRWAS